MASSTYGVPIGLEARGEHEPPTVIENHQLGVPQPSLLHVLLVGVAQHLAEATTSRARLLTVTRHDGKVRAHLRDKAVAVAPARLLLNLALLRLSCNRPTLFLAGVYDFILPLFSELVWFIFKRGKQPYGGKGYTALICNFVDFVLSLQREQQQKIYFKNCQEKYTYSDKESLSITVSVLSSSNASSTGLLNARPIFISWVLAPFFTDADLMSAKSSYYSLPTQVLISSLCM